MGKRCGAKVSRQGLLLFALYMTLPSGQGARVTGRQLAGGLSFGSMQHGGRDKRSCRAYGLSLDTEGAYPRELLPESPGGENLDRYAVGDWS